jgi:hypothetical protein
MEHDPLHDPDDFMSMLLSSPPKTYRADLSRSSVVAGSPGLFEGLAVATWSR